MKRGWPQARYVLPLVVDPSQTVCFQIEVPKDRYHIAAFLGAIFSLSTPYSWQNDNAHTAILVGAVWRKIFDNLQRDNCCRPPPVGSAGADDGSEFMIRQNPDNPCEIQSSVDGVTWCTFIDISLCIPAGPQPGGGSPQPSPGGGCQTYHGQFQARNQWILPTVVSTGDTINIPDPTGAADDGGGTWYCPDGQLFFAGNCVGLPTVTGTDPAVAAPHMVIVANIGGTFYNVTGGVFTVPGGISNQPVVLQVNDSTLSDNNGEYTFDVEVCNNQAGAWTSIFDFTASPFAPFLVATAGMWVPGVGWVGTAITQPFTLILEGHPTSCNITSWDALYDCPSHGGTNDDIRLVLNSADYATPGPFVTGTNQHFSQAGAIAAVTEMATSMNSGSTASSNFALKRWTITGTGAKPPEFP